jgi:hypothetical protein
MGIGEDGLIKGWVCRVVEKNGDWLGSSTGHHTKRGMDGKVHPVGSKVLISHGYK